MRPEETQGRVGQVFAAVDIGASSGRALLGRIADPSLGGAPSVRVVHRFPNAAAEVDGGLRWDFEALFAQVIHGLAAAAGEAARAGERIVSIGVDTWAVDYGLVDGAGALVAAPFSHRDARGGRAAAAVHAVLHPERLYAVTGMQFLPFNTIYQLASEPELKGLQALLMPDLVAFRLTGQRRTEVTNASTTGLFDARAGTWATALFSALGLPERLFPPLIEPGETIGVLLPGISAATGLPEGTPVVAVGSHDTASAVAAVPARTEAFAYISSGTWSLVGVELQHPVLTAASRAANFTNERGVDGSIRYLRNVGGMWLLNECLRFWQEAGTPEELGPLLGAAAALPAGGAVIDVESDDFIAPGGMPARIARAVRAGGGQLSGDRAAVVRCILDSLALCYAGTVARAVELSGRHVEVVHIVGGGSQNGLLCSLTAEATGLPVLAGPVEATALGNVLIQACAAGAVAGPLSELRRLFAVSQPVTTYRPLPGAAPEAAVGRESRQGTS